MNFPSRHITQRSLVLSFFALLLSIGIYCHNDFGLQVDSVRSFNRGLATHDYIMNFDNKYKDKFDTHGWVFDTIVHFILTGLNISDSCVFFRAKHFMTFLLFFVSAVFFYRLCRDHFGSWRLGLCGSFFLVLCPRIFAHSFYNPKDSPCVDLFIISVYTLIMYLNKKTCSRAAIHALACSLLVATRNIGVLVIFMTGLFVMADLIFCRRERGEWKRFAGSLFLFLFLCASLVILFWPVLWPHPLDYFINGISEMKHYDHNPPMIYMGKIVHAFHLPWHYILVWMSITIPVVYVVLFCFGILEAVRAFFCERHAYFLKRNTLIFLIWFFVPVGAVICLHSVLYHAWRHVSFVYPALLIFSLKGIVFWNKIIARFFYAPRARILQKAFAGGIALSLAPVVLFMVKYHPLEDVYFNEWVGGTPGAKYRYEMDYWGISYRQGLEYILSHDSREKIKVGGQDLIKMNINSLILPQIDRRKLEFVSSDQADYFINIFILNKEYPYDQELYSFKVGGVKIVAVYKVK